MFESRGVFSLQETGLFICYQPTSATDSVWTFMNFHMTKSYNLTLLCFVFCTFVYLHLWLYVAVLT